MNLVSTLAFTGVLIALNFSAGDTPINQRHSPGISTDIAYNRGHELYLNGHYQELIEYAEKQRYDERDYHILFNAITLLWSDRQDEEIKRKALGFLADYESYQAQIGSLDGSADPGVMLVYIDEYDRALQSYQARRRYVSDGMQAGGRFENDARAEKVVSTLDRLIAELENFRPENEGQKSRLIERMVKIFNDSGLQSGAAAHEESARSQD